MDLNDQIHLEKEKKPKTVRWVASVGVAISLSIVAMSYGYFADDISSAVSHLSPWITLPLLIICGVLYALYWFAEMVTCLAGACDLFIWGRNAVREMRTRISIN